MNGLTVTEKIRKARTHFELLWGKNGALYWYADAALSLAVAREDKAYEGARDYTHAINDLILDIVALLDIELDWFTDNADRQELQSTMEMLESIYLQMEAERFGATSNVDHIDIASHTAYAFSKLHGLHEALMNTFDLSKYNDETTAAEAASNLIKWAQGNLLKGYIDTAISHINASITELALARESAKAEKRRGAYKQLALGLRCVRDELDSKLSCEQFGIDEEGLTIDGARCIKGKVCGTY